MSRSSCMSSFSAAVLCQDAETQLPLLCVPSKSLVSILIAAFRVGGSLQKEIQQVLSPARWCVYQPQITPDSHLFARAELELWYWFDQEAVQPSGNPITHLTMCAGVASPLCVFWTVVPKQTHHQLS